AVLEDVPDLDPPGDPQRLTAARTRIAGARHREREEVADSRVPVDRQAANVPVAPAGSGHGVDRAANRAVGKDPHVAAGEMVGSDVSDRRAGRALDLLLGSERQ